jgi:hypothetical protein
MKSIRLSLYMEPSGIDVQAESIKAVLRTITRNGFDMTDSQNYLQSLIIVLQ